MHYRLAVAAVAMMAAIGAAPQIAGAQDFDIHVGGPDRGPPPPGYGRPPGYPPPPGFDDEEGGPPPPPRYARGCDPDDAADEARDMGFRHAHVVDVNSRRIVVEGFTRDGPGRMFFANVRGCPIMRR